jgi:hypothetical protein
VRTPDPMHWIGLDGGWGDWRYVRAACSRGLQLKWTGHRNEHSHRHRLDPSKVEAEVEGAC